MNKYCPFKLKNIDYMKVSGEPGSFDIWYRCDKYCAWFNEKDNQCCIKSIANKLKSTSTIKFEYLKENEILE